MKVISVPSSGACGKIVAYISPFGQVHRARVVPRNTRSSARDFMRGVFGSNAQGWGRKLSQEQRDRWNFAGPQVMSHPRLGQSGPLTGQQHYEGINSVLGCVGRPPVWEPPAPVTFGRNPVGQLVMTNGEGGVRLLLKVAGPVTEDIMVFGQAPCSAGRSRRRNVAYLGLLPLPKDGMSEITDIYKAKYGEPRAGTKVFIVTRQQKDGWQGQKQQTSEIVPDWPEGGQAVAQAALSLEPYMYKGCTRDSEGTTTPVAQGCQEGDKAKAPGGEAAGAGLEGRTVLGGEGDAPV